MAASEFSRHPFVLALGWALLHFLWQGAVIAGLLFAAQAILRKSSANSRYIAACLALLLMAVCPLATFCFLATPNARGMMPASVAISPVEETIVLDPLRIAPRPTAQSSASRRAAPEEFATRLQKALPGIVASWLGVVCLLSLRLLLGYSRVRRIKNQACESLGVYWTEKLSDLATQLRVSRPVQLCQSALVEVPTVIGWLRPVILFPASALAGLTPAQLEAILAHELAHIRRHDYLVNLLQNLIETLLFYHPAVWWVSRHVSQERELCCDDLTVEVCGDRINYAKALATLEELRNAAPGWALAADGGSLLRRIRRLAGAPTESNRSGWWVAGMLTLALVTALCLAGRSSLMASASDAKPPARSPEAAPATNAQLVQDGRQTFERDEPAQGRLAESPGVFGAEVEIPAGRKFFLSEGSGMLLVTATPEELDEIERVVQPLNASPPTMNVSRSFKWNLSAAMENLTEALKETPEERIVETNLFAGFTAFLRQSGIFAKAPNTLIFHDDGSPPDTFTAWAPTIEELNVIDRAVQFLNTNAPAKIKPAPAGAPVQAVPARDVAASNLAAARTSRAPAVKETASAQISDARILIELGKLEEAKAKLEEVLKQEPDNKRARSYLNFIHEMRQATKSEVQTIFKQALEDFEKTQATPSSGLEYRPGSGLSHSGTSAGRQAILQRMDSMVLDEISYDDAPLSEVVKDLNQRARKISPPGINFIINSPVELPAGAGSREEIDPVTGQPSPRAVALGSVDLTKVLIRINPPLRNVKMRHVLDAITKVADKPLQYLIEDYAVVITPRAPGPPQLFTRTFRVDPSTFIKNLRQTMSGFTGPTNFTEWTNLNEAVQGFFRQVGVDLPTTTGQGGGIPGGFSPPVTIPSQDPSNSRKAVFFNDRTGVLFVRATLEDIDTIEQALLVLNQAPQQVQIDLKWVELSDADAKDLGFDWFLAKQIHSADSTNAQIQPNPAGVSTNVTLNVDTPASKSPRTANAPVATATGILTEPQFNVVLKALKQRSGVTFLSRPSVTTVSGQSAQLEVMQPKKIVVDRQITKNPKDDRDAVKVNYVTADIPVGSLVEVTPWVLNDLSSIQVKVIAKTTEFVGYDQPRPAQNRIEVDGIQDQSPLSASLPLPRFRIREATGSASVFSGQTVVLSGFLSRETRNPQDKVPVLGDIPLLGRLFRSELQSKTNKHLILFVTPAIVDPAGNRVHPPEKSSN